jgi:hypothetical protein
MLHNLSSENLSACFTSIHKAIDSLKCDFSKSDTETYLTRHQVAEMLQCDISTVHNWTKSGILKAYGIGARVYYKKSEIEASMLPIHRLKHK